MKIKVLNPLKSEYQNILVLSAKFMHGDVDQETYPEMKLSFNATEEIQQETLREMKEVIKVYTSSTQTMGYANWKIMPEQLPDSLRNLEMTEPGSGATEEEVEAWEDYMDSDEYLDGNNHDMIPWDACQAEISMYENRGKLEKWSLVYYDANGNAFNVEIED